MTMDMVKNKKNENGFTLIEALVVLFIFALISVTFYSVFSLGTRYIQDTKNRLGAIAVANERMEIIRNLKYEDIGTVNGIPEGGILSDEDITENTRTFNVKTYIKYIDDPFDDVAPTDTIPTDYKSVKVTVSWSGSTSSGSVFLVSRFVPQGIEQNSGDGTLSINIMNDHGDGVGQASVHIVNNLLSPTVNITAKTDNTGNLMLPGAKESISGYEVTVSKDNYETVETVDQGDVTYVPVDTHASVVQGLLNTKSIVINLLVSLKIKAVDSLGGEVSSLAFKLKGGRVLGVDTSVVPAQNVYNLDVSTSTDTNGEKDFNDKSPGQYFLSDIGSVSGHTFVGVKNAESFDLATNIYTILMTPAEEKTAEIKFAADNEDGLLVKIKKEDNTPLKGAEVIVKNDSSYNVTQMSGADGYAFFPVTTDVFSPGDYNIEVKADGYNTSNKNVNVNKLTTEEIKLTVL